MPVTELKKWSTTVTKDKSASDTAQIPGASLTVDVYKRGATVSVAVGTIAGSGGTATVSVYDIGRLSVNDTVQVGTTSANNLTVTAISSATSITVRNDGASGFGLNQYDRLVITSGRPTLYRDVTGSAIYPTPGQTTTDSRGYVSFFLTERYFDYIVTDGTTKSLYQDEESGQVRLRRNYFNIMDFPGNSAQGAQVDVVAALSAIPAGSNLYFPNAEGPFVPPTSAGWTISKDGIEIYMDSDGAGEDKGFLPFQTGVAPNGTKNSSVWLIADGVKWPYIHDSVFSQPGGFIPTDTDGTGDHIRFIQGGGSVVIERCFLGYPGRSGIRGTTGVNYLVRCSINDCRVFQPTDYGVKLFLTTMLTMKDITVQAPRRGGVWLNNSANGNIHIDSGAMGSIAGMDANLDGLLVLEDCADIHVSGGNLEDYRSSSIAKNGIVLSGCRGCIIEGNELDNNASVAGTRSIYIRASATRGSFNNFIGPNVVVNSATAVEIENVATNVGNIVMPQAVQLADATSPGKIVIPSGSRNFAFLTNLTSGTADNKGVGMLFPSMPGVANIDSSVIQDGLFVYDSTAAALKVRIGGVWKTVTVT